jgi:ATP-dependent helicase/nuclease subunit A
MSVVDLIVRPPVDPQRLAADPTLSAFVTANAGSGKTKTLIDRVARLLLEGAEPSRILCVTYTKAAAAEMQRRLFDLLGDWSVMGGERLAEKLRELDGRQVDPRDEAALSKARQLFARALETPGGLKIQTIHAFCEKLLRRFPLEAGVSPAFKVMDDAAAAAIVRAARDAVAEYAARGDGAVAEAFARFSLLDFAAFEGMFRDFEARRGALASFFTDQGGLPGAIAWVWRKVDVTAGTDPEDLACAAVAALDRSLWRSAADVLMQGGKRDQENAARLRAVAEAADTGFADCLSVLFTAGGEGKEAEWCAKAKVLDAHPTVRTFLLAEQTRLHEVRERIRGAQVAWDTADALTLAAAYLQAYGVEKAQRGALDFADLIEKTCALLASRPAAAWVLYKLDGGIDHVLVDEAQDTAPDQWTIVRALTEEFFSGAGQPADRALDRNMFVVGDLKQSIYSFQGAQPEQLRHEFEFHRDRATGAGYRFEQVDLLTSWRSAPRVLSFVDAVFAGPELSAAIHGVATPPQHLAAAIRKDHPGCVDIWPLEEEPESTDRTAWDAPLDVAREDNATRGLARRIAVEIKALIERGDAVFDKAAGGWRPAHAGDVLILVRRRKALFEEILRALKREEVPVAGADRLPLSQHIVFDDLLALARFVLLPSDELNLAALLKSPFCGLDDQALYDLAHGREAENLWTRLQALSTGSELLATLHAAQALAGRPFEFFSRFLGRIGPDGQSMRRRVLTRLGAEAEDALDEFLSQVLAAEGRGVHDLQALVADFARLDITVKREMEGAREEVRVMTAHGAKGLEAPIVFLPETTLTQTQRGSPLMETEDGGFLWCASAKGDCEPSTAARVRRTRREAEEAYRLLYVALTRARDRLVLCGRKAARGTPPWWTALSEALANPQISADVRSVRCGDRDVRRFGEDPRPMGRGPRREASAAPIPAWASAAARPEAFGRYASPSDLAEGARGPSPSPLAQAGGLGRFRRGDLIHRLLQLLPDVAPEARAAGAAALLAREADLTDAQRSEMAQAALAVLDDARFGEVFGAGSRAEVAVAGTAALLRPGLKISGRIDRLVVLPDRVLVVDFKTNRPSPERVEDADRAYLRQMALYAAVLGEVFGAGVGGRRIEAALVWTDGPKLMPIPENLLAQTLAALRQGVDTA